jgi:hypothetical protein
MKKVATPIPLQWNWEDDSQDCGEMALGTSPKSHYLPLVLLADRISTKGSTGYSPYELIFRGIWLSHIIQAVCKYVPVYQARTNNGVNPKNSPHWPAPLMCVSQVSKSF